MLDFPYPVRRLSPLETRLGSRPPPRVYMWQLLRRAWDTSEASFRILDELTPRDRIAVDVGAGRGIYTHYLSWCCTHVEAFEPNPRLFQLLQKSLPGNARAHQIALSEAAAERALIVPMHGSIVSHAGGSMRPVREGKRHTSIPVASWPLDAFALHDVGLIRIDVAGAERAVIAGARETLARERPIVVIETREAPANEPIEETLAAVSALGFAGAFLRDGALHPLADFDPHADHRAKIRRADCVTTFVFRPR
jgi:FkbM family methyltransferase